MVKPPVAERIPHRVSYHGITLEDPYHWLKDPSYPNVEDERVLAYLEAENAYFEACMRPHQGLIDALFEEIRGRQPEEDASVPYRKDGFWYQWRYEKGAQYRTWLRAPVDDPDRWSVFLDEPELAGAHDYFTLGGLAVSPDGRYLAWSSDTSGAERFTLSIKDLATGVLLDEKIEGTLGSPVWGADSRFLYYVVVNEQWRPYEVRRHRLGEPLARDRTVYTEQADSFFVGLDETQSERFILITAGDHVTSEVRCFPADAPDAEPVLIARRRRGHEYYVDHRGRHFYIRTNDEHRNFRLARAPDNRPQPEHWETVIGGSDEHYLTGHLCLADYLVVSERIDGLDQIRVREDDGTEHHVAFPEGTYAAGFGTNAEYETSTLRLGYQSMVTPHTVFDYDIPTRSLTTRKVQKIPSGYDASAYRTERLHATARDGTQVPISVVYPKNLRRDGSAPLYLYGYGAYGHAISPGFSATRLSLLERGFTYAIAHIRGGDDLGYRWYENGKLDKRTNTFNDFVDCARYLTEAGFTSPGRIAISGGSAGGELMGAAVNQAPELFGAVAAHVPFVDVLNTMLDPELPLTPIEWPEWGNPIEDRAMFELIRSYSPYDQLKPGRYPAMLLTAGLNDPRVTYWEPAKYVAKLRTLKSDGNWLLLKTNMGAGHRGESGRFDALKEAAEEYAFVLVSLGLVETGGPDTGRGVNEA